MLLNAFKEEWESVYVFEEEEKNLKWPFSPKENLMKLFLTVRTNIFMRTKRHHHELHFLVISLFLSLFITSTFLCNVCWATFIVQYDMYTGLASSVWVCFPSFLFFSPFIEKRKHESDWSHFGTNTHMLPSSGIPLSL